MIAYVARRLLSVAFLLVAVSVLTFAVFYLLPSGDPAVLRAGRHPDDALLQQIRHQLALDEPWHAQLGEYLRRLITDFDLGHSYQTNTAVSSEILDRLPATISLAVGAAAIALIVGIAIGVLCALRPTGPLDRAAMLGASLALSLPVYWLGLVALYLLADDIGQVKLLPGAGSYVPPTQDPGKWFGSLLLAWFVLATPFAAYYTRLLRSTMIEALASDHIRAARAKGLHPHTVLRHALRSAITPIVTAAGLDLGVLLGGAVLVEIVFDIPGVGRLAFESVQNADLPMIQGTVLFAAVFIAIANLVVDVLYTFIDPRLRP